jgi:hypothetical protein
VVWVRGEEVLFLVSNDKWLKTQAQVQELSDLLEECQDTMPRLRLEEIRGLLVHISRTYTRMVPHLNGLHLTIDGWRDSRDDEGWRKKRHTRPNWIKGTDYDFPSTEFGYQGPERAKAVPRLVWDIHALEKLTSPIKPPLVLV